MADLTNLGELQAVDTLDLSPTGYTDTKESTFRLPVAGKYTLQAPPEFPAAAFGRTKKGDLSIEVSPTILAPTNEGFKTRFIKVSAKVFDRAGKKVSQLGDYLRACGVTGTLRTEADQANAVESTANMVYEAILDWSAYNSKTQFKVQGMRNFPKLADGSYQTWVEDPTDKDPVTGKPVRLRANIIVDKYIAASN